MYICNYMHLNIVAYNNGMTYNTSVMDQQMTYESNKFVISLY